jgi:hypothetical protein
MPTGPVNASEIAPSAPAGAALPSPKEARAATFIRTNREIRRRLATSAEATVNRAGPPGTGRPQHQAKHLTPLLNMIIMADTLRAEFEL